MCNPRLFNPSNEIPHKIVVSQFRQFIAKKLKDYIDDSYRSDYLLPCRLAATTYLEKHIYGANIEDINVISMVFDHIKNNFKPDTDVKDNFSEVRKLLLKSLCQFLGLSEEARNPQIEAKIKAEKTIELMQIVGIRPKL